jgi:hypothetical protein
VNLQARARRQISLAYLFRSAQRFFIANDILLLPSGVRALPCFPFGLVSRSDATFVFFTVPDEFSLSSAAIARPSLSLSCLSSVTISFVSTFDPSYRQVISLFIHAASLRIQSSTMYRISGLNNCQPRKANHSDFAWLHKPNLSTIFCFS